MKKSIKIILLIGSILFVGCGGGGSSSGDSGLTYSGKTTAAKLNGKSAKDFIESVLDFSGSSDFTSTYSSNNKLSKSMQEKSKLIRGNRGTIDLTITSIDNLTTKVVAVYKDYSEKPLVTEENPMLNGKITYILIADKRETSFVKKANLTMSLLNVKTSTSDITIEGTINIFNDDDNTTCTQNFIIKDNQSSAMFKFENFIIYLDHNEKVLGYEGKVYDSEEGYVLITTPIRLTYEEGSYTPNAGGEILYEGEDSVVRERIAYDGTVRVELDRGKNGIVDEFEVYNSETMEVVPNRAPVSSIIFPKEIFTNTDLSVVKVNSYDPDLDEITLQNEWKVNNIVKSNNLTLDSTLFKKHDILKLTVVAKDNRAESKTATVSKVQEVLNSRPIPVLKLEKTEVEIGDNIIVDASTSYDADNDEISFNWTTQNRRYNIHDDIYNSGTNYLRINENNKSKIIFLGEEINYDMFNEISSYGINLTLDDKDTNGISDINSSDIKVIPQDLFNKKLISLKDIGVINTDIMAVQAGDLNKDNLKDIVLIVSKDGDYSGVDRLIILFQDTTGDFKNVLKISLEAEDVYTFNYTSINIADMNNDGLQDITIATGHEYFYTYYQNEEGSFREKKKYNTKQFSDNSFEAEAPIENTEETIAYGVEYLKSIDINNDGKLDMLTVGHNYQATPDMGIDIFLQNENNLTDEKILYLESDEIDRVLVNDMDNNGLKDILVSNHIFYQETNGSFSEKEFSSLSYMMGKNIDNDSNMEIVGVDKDSDNLVLFKADSNISRNYIKEIDKNIVASNPNQVEIHDMNSDNKEDIIIGHNGYSLFSLLAKKDNQDYLGNQLYKGDKALAYSTMKHSLIVDDINNDGKSDVILFGRERFELFYAK